MAIDPVGTFFVFIVDILSRVRRAREIIDGMDAKTPTLCM